jgi:hypothetical protein
LNGKINCFAKSSYRKAARACENAGGLASQTPQIPPAPAASANGSGTPQLPQKGAETKFTRRKHGPQNCPSDATGASQARQDGGSNVSNTARPIGFSTARKVTA